MAAETLAEHTWSIRSPAKATANGRRELRLAIVCYGGVSLCVYMHGTTKELHRLVKASRLLASGATGGGGTSKSEQLYLELLDRASGPDGVRTDVVVDVIAGTSAGGINGVFLAKALAHNLPQEGLRDLWFDKGDIKKLLRGPAWIPIWLKTPWLLLQVAKRPPLRGKDMSVWLYDALQSMDEGGASPKELTTLMPAGHGLQLFVTMTDFYGYDRQITISDPKLAHDRRHRHVFEFEFDNNGTDLFTGDHNLGLAFAARATSCFPGAFPPVSAPLFKQYLPNAQGDLEHTFFRLYELSGVDVDRTYFVDGGVLDNRPFGHVISAIRQKHAEVEVDRKLLYLEPDPGGPAPPAPGKAPETIAAVLGAVSGIPRREPILDDLLEVTRLNERVQRIRDIVETSFDRVAAKIDETLDNGLAAEQLPDADTVGGWQSKLNDAARLDAGTTYATYLRSKISNVIDRFATMACAVCAFPADANQAMLVRSVSRCWAEVGGLFERDAQPTQAQIEFLRDFDLDYGVRRLQFVIAGLNAWYGELDKAGTPPREQIDAVKARLWQAVDELRAAMSGAEFTSDLRDGVTVCFPIKDIDRSLEENGFAPEEYARSKRGELGALRDSLRMFLQEKLQHFTATLYGDLVRLTDGWSWPRRRELLVRFLGFPLWDVLLFPIQSVADAGERDAVEVIRMSPRDARLLRPLRPGHKLEGIGFAHFRGFFARRYRENDYLWGRLDAAERLIGIVLGTDHPEFERWCGRAFLAILDEEEQSLPRVRPFVSALRSQAEALAAG